MRGPAKEQLRGNYPLQLLQSLVLAIYPPTTSPLGIIRHITRYRHTQLQALQASTSTGLKNARLRHTYFCESKTINSSSSSRCLHRSFAQPLLIWDLSQHVVGYLPVQGQWPSFSRQTRSTGASITARFSFRPSIGQYLLSTLLGSPQVLKEPRTSTTRCNLWN